MSSTDPADGEIGVPINTMISATFSEAMDPATITPTTFTLMRGTTPVAGTVAYDGVTAIFSPTSNLLPNTLYTATIMTGAEALDKISKDNSDVAHGIGLAVLLAGFFLTGHGDRSDALEEDFVWTFTTGAAPDTIAPTVNSTVPANGSIDVALGGNLAATFSESMAPSTINTSTFTLRQGATPVAGTVAYAGVTATFNPTSDLEPLTTYTATVSMEAADLAGIEMEEDFVWTFTTGAAPDTTAPMVSSTFPRNRDTGVSPDSSLAASFSEAMNPSTISTATFTLRQGATPVSGTVFYVGVTALFNPASDLDANTLYTATITAGAEDLAGNALAVSYVWTFTTGEAPDATAPMISSTDPVDEAADVPVNEKVAATFSEAMNPLTITAETFALMQGITPVAGTVSYVGVTATFTPVDDLEPDTTYTATVLMEAADLAGNELSADYMWTFTTGAAPDTTAPMISFTVPINGTTGVLLGRNLAATFSEAMNPLTITTATFTLLDDEMAPVLGLVTYAGVTATFNPSSNLAPDTLYTARITTGAEDLAGNALASNYTWTFTTGETPDTTPPMVSFTSPVDEAEGVLLNKNIAATFTEAM
ncbi:MAG: Ig-like domain-containing protein, partial [Acidobacteria bacterium]|nr:Ig-like domain-containing protein [Acidobacteriota bacterium]